eukprot:11157236-Lingulodinium_polyedra.AAC.1
MGPWNRDFVTARRRDKGLKRNCHMVRAAARVLRVAQRCSGRSLVLAGSRIVRFCWLRRSCDFVSIRA